MASEGEMVTVTVWVGRLLAVAVMYLVSVRVGRALELLGLQVQLARLA